MITTPARLAAALSDRYRLERELGQGGMATVYLAEDLKHKRQVAIKVLKPELAAVLGAERFVQEITTTAALQHPHILPLFDSGTADGFLYYVMPYIQGETLRSKLDRETQLGIDEAVRIASDVASALHYAHQHGVIHRDIKPENILLHDGRPMVADFGIALAVSAAAGGRMTETGLSLGTPHYMSPEQATAEKEISARSDVYSLGSVLYEMLTGEPPHMGTSAQQIIMKIITEDAAPVTKLRKAVPPNVAAAVAKSLEKLPADRFESAKAFADALGNQSFTVPGAQALAGPRRGRSGLVGVAPRVAGLAAGTLLAVGLGGAWIGSRFAAGRGEPAPAVMRFEIALPRDSTAPPLPAGGTSTTISPDGRTIVATGAGPEGVPHLFVRRVDELDWRLLPGTANAIFPFFSPTGEWVGFQLGATLMKVRLDGRTPIELARISRMPLSRANWGAGDRIVFELDGRLASVPGEGGTVRLLPVADSGAVQTGQVSPVLLADGQHVIYSLNTGLAGGEIRIAGIESGASTVLAVRGRPVAMFDDLLIFIDAVGALSAIRFDPVRRVTVGDPVAILVPNTAGGRTDRGSASVAANGALVYVGGETRFTLVDHEFGGADRVFGSWLATGTVDPRLSPDGDRIVLFVNQDVWVVPTALGSVPQRLTSDSASFRPEWTPDGRQVMYRSLRGGRNVLRLVSAAGATEDTLTIAHPEFEIWQGDLSPDQRWLVLRTGTQAGADIWYREFAGDTTLRPVATTPAIEHSPQFSPDGRWIAYVSTESGTEEVYVRAFPPRSAALRISLNGAEEPIWSPTGRELYYREGDRIVRATLRPDSVLRVDTRTVVVQPYRTFTSGHASYDITRDGKGIVMGRITSPNTRLVYVHNWLDEVRTRLAAAPR